MHKLNVGHNWTAALWLFTIGLGFLFVDRSAQPVMRLRLNAPAEFFESRPEWSAQQRAAEDHLARAYWESAVKSLQWKYSFGSSLPNDPPPEFYVDGRAFAGMNTSTSRPRYWRKLQRVWALPQAWEKKYRWDTHWLLTGRNG